MKLNIINLKRGKFMEKVCPSNDELLIKWSRLIQAAKDYYIECVPTGLSDIEFDNLESQAIIEDGFYVRDYVYNTYLKGVKTQNNYIDKIKKVKLKPGQKMLDAIIAIQSKYDQPIRACLKLDGGSLAIYLDPETGKVRRIVTVGNLNIDNFGVDQTAKLIKLLPRVFPRGILAIQAEAIIELSVAEEFGIVEERARQKACGLLNSKDMSEEVLNLLSIRPFRYFPAPGWSIGNYRNTMDSINLYIGLQTRHPYRPTCKAVDSWSVEELIELDRQFPGVMEKDITDTPSGRFQNDGWVVYDNDGQVICAIKYPFAGDASEKTNRTTVLGLLWNNQVSKGKDSWSANVLVEPVTVRGSVMRKPSAGSVKTVVTKNITRGAEVSVVLAGSTIPKVGEVFKPGCGDYEWPRCSCGYQMSQADTFGSFLKCGNTNCSERGTRMSEYLSKINDVLELDLDKLLVIDRVKYKSFPGYAELVQELNESVMVNDYDRFYSAITSVLTTELQMKNAALVAMPAFVALRLRIYGTGDCKE